MSIFKYLASLEETRLRNTLSYMDIMSKKHEELRSIRSQIAEIIEKYVDYNDPAAWKLEEITLSPEDSIKLVQLDIEQSVRNDEIFGHSCKQIDVGTRQFKYAMPHGYVNVKLK